MNQSHLGTVNVQTQSTKTREKLPSFVKAGHPAGTHKLGLFLCLGSRGRGTY